MKQTRFYGLCAWVAILIFTALMASGYTASPPAQTFKLKLTNPVPPPPYTVSIVMDWWAQEIKKRTNGRVEIQVFHGGTLSKPKEEMEAVKSGLADFGFVNTVYYPIELALGNAPFVVPFGPTDPMVIAKVIPQMYAKFPAWRNEVERFNQKNVGFYQPLGNYQIMSRVPIRKLADLKGLKLASIGSYHPKILADAGSVPIAMPSIERYEALQTGVIAGAVLPYDGQVSIRIHERAKYAVNVDLGCGYGGLITANADLWKRLPQDVAKIISDVSAEATVRTATLTNERIVSAIKTMKDAKVEIIDFPASEKMKWVNQLPNYPMEWAKEMDAKRLPGTETMKTYFSLIQNEGYKPVRDWLKK